MGLALLVYRAPGLTWASGDHFSLLGASADSPTEANSQVSCTEGATFSLLGVGIFSGNSGTATFIFQDAGANGNQTFQITGTGTNEDAVNTDVLSAGDLFGVSYTDTGTAAAGAYAKANVQFTSGHGNFHGSAGYSGRVYDVQSATRFISLAGDLQTDGTTTEDNAEWKVRGYDSFAALQVRVTANARTNNSDFKNRINGADGSLLCQFTSGATGLISDTSPADAITDGQTINASITLDTGLEDLTVTFVAATLKSSTNKSETFASDLGGVARTASATAHYVVIGGQVNTLTELTEAQARLKVGFAAVVSNLRCYLSANTYTVNGTLKLYQNGSPVITTTITASGGAAWYENTTDTITIDADDELSFEFDEGNAGSITIHSAGITFAPVGGGAVTKTMTLDSAIQATRQATSSTEAAIAEERSAVATLDAAMAITRTATASLDAAVRATLAATATADAAVRGARTTSALADAVIATGREQSETLDAAVAEVRIADVILDAAIRAARTATTNVDAAISASRSVSASLDSALATAFSKSATLDAMILEAAGLTASLDAAIEATRTSSASLDAAVALTRSLSSSLDASISAAIVATLTTTLDAAIRAARSAAATADAAVSASKSASTLADAIILAQRSASATLSAAIRVRIAISATADAAIVGGRTASTTIEAMLARTETISLSADAILLARLSVSANIAAAIRAAAAVSGTVDAFISAIATAPHDARGKIELERDLDEAMMDFILAAPLDELMDYVQPPPPADDSMDF